MCKFAENFSWGLAKLGVCKGVFLIMAGFHLTPLTAALPLGNIPQVITLSGDVGGLVGGGKWTSKSLKGKVHMLVYSTVSAKDLNKKATTAVKKHNFPLDKFATVAVINMASSWQPNWVIDRALKSKQEEFPNTLYVKDFKNTLDKVWGLKDKSNDIIVFNSKGHTIFSIDGQLNDSEIDLLITTINEEINPTKATSKLNIRAAKAL